MVVEGDFDRPGRLLESGSETMRAHRFGVAECANDAEERNKPAHLLRSRDAEVLLDAWFILVAPVGENDISHTGEAWKR